VNVYVCAHVCVTKGFVRVPAFSNVSNCESVGLVLGHSACLLLFVISVFANTVIK